MKRLYNFLHLGQIAELSAMMCVTETAPLLRVAPLHCWSRWMPA